jgi:hypothetical protein
MPVSVALSMLAPASLIKQRPLPPHSRLFEVLYCLKIELVSSCFSFFLIL